MADLSVPFNLAGCSSERSAEYLESGGGNNNSIDISGESLVDKTGPFPSIPRLEYTVPSSKQQLQPVGMHRPTLTETQRNDIMPKIQELQTFLTNLEAQFKEGQTGGSEPETAFEAAHSRVAPCENVSPKAQICKPYQATVEDGDTEFEDISSCEGGGMTPDSAFAASPTMQMATSDLPTPASSVRSGSISSVASAGAAWLPKINGRPDEKPSALRSPELAEPKAKPSVRWSNRPPIVLHGRVSDLSPTSTRPPIGERTVTDPVQSTVDLPWGQLFDGNGNPTRRFEDVLRGLAKYLIEGFTPIDSGVVTPEKLCRLYDMCSQPPEIVPFHAIFDCSSRDDFKDLGYLFRDLRCEHHLIQGHGKAKPYIPGLTITGFRDWMTLLVKAYPDREAHRLSSIFEKLPIEVEWSPPYGGRERLSKQLPRHLLPAVRHEPTYGFVSNSIEKWKREAGFKEGPLPSLKSSPRPPSIAVASGGPKGYTPSHETEKYRLDVQRAPINRSSSYTSVPTYPGPPMDYERAPILESRGRQGPDLMPPPIGVHHPRRRSPLEQFRNREPPGLSCSPNSNYCPSRDRPSANQGMLVVRPHSSIRSGSRWSREDEYRFLQGRDPRASLEGQAGRYRRGS